MAKLPAVNTSPLIFLSKSGYLDLLQLLSPEIIVPKAVATEIEAYGTNDITALKFHLILKPIAHKFN